MSPSLFSAESLSWQGHAEDKKCSSVCEPFSAGTTRSRLLSIVSLLLIFCLIKHWSRTSSPTRLLLDAYREPRAPVFTCWRSQGVKGWEVFFWWTFLMLPFQEYLFWRKEDRNLIGGVSACARGLVNTVSPSVTVLILSVRQKLLCVQAGWATITGSHRLSRLLSGSYLFETRHLACACVSSAACAEWAKERRKHDSRRGELKRENPSHASYTVNNLSPGRSFTLRGHVGSLCLGCSSILSHLFLTSDLPLYRVTVFLATAVQPPPRPIDTVGVWQL